MSAVTPFGTILLYVEAKERSIDAAKYAIVMAKSHNAVLHVVYVVNEKILEELLHARVFLKEEVLALKRDLEEDGRHYLSLVEKLAKKKGVSYDTQILRGHVYEEVVNKADDIGATLLILGEIEESLTRRDATFNESERIMCAAECPVLVVKGRELVNSLFDSL